MIIGPAKKDIDLVLAVDNGGRARVKRNSSEICCSTPPFLRLARGRKNHEQQRRSDY
jgi:hypothetical protein